MAAWRLRRCRVTALPAFLLLQLLRSQATQGDITCPTPISVEHADIRVKSYSLSSRERYTCNSGFKRKAGTSSLTECVLNEITNTAHWTTPNLKCIQPEASTSKSDTKVTTETAIAPSSRRMPSEPASTGTTRIVRNGFSPAPSQTADKTLEQTHPASHMTPDTSSDNSTAVADNSSAFTVAVPIVLLLGVLCVLLFLAYYKRTRQQLPTPNVEMDNMEDTPMTGQTSHRREVTDDFQYSL